MTIMLNENEKKKLQRTSMQTDALDNILQKDKNNNDQGDNYDESGDNDNYY